MRDAGFDVTTAAVDVAKRQTVRTLVEQATALGGVTGLIDRTSQHALARSRTPGRIAKSSSAGTTRSIVIPASR